MEKKKISVIWIAILGVVIGALSSHLGHEIYDRNASLKARNEDWLKLNLLLRTAQENYVDTIDFGKVTDAASEAALQALDPHSVYLPPEDLKASDEDLMGNFEGIGIQFNVPNDTAVVLEVIAGGPSEKIGLQQGDRILKVDDKVIAGVKFPQDSIVRRIKGPSGTKVTITVNRNGEIIPFEIIRGKIPTHSVDAAFMISENTGYLRLSKFSRTTASEVAEALDKLTGQGMTHLLFDVRDNSGGFLDQALSLSNMFLEKGKLIVYMQGRRYRRQEVFADGKGLYKDLNLTLLVNDGSASSSEIFAGAMQDNGRARLVGRRTFGKGLVQEPYNFSDGSGFRLTVARYYTPSGRCIQKPYTDNYIYEVYDRYNTGEMYSADSMKLEKGGILPDVFVPVDTAKVGSFYMACNKKATAMRFASSFFDSHKASLTSIDNFDRLLAYLASSNLESGFLDFAKAKDGIAPSAGEWAVSKPYLMTQVKALVGRYSKLGDNAFYHIYLDVDDIVKAALTEQ